MRSPGGTRSGIMRSFADSQFSEILAAERTSCV